MPLGAVNYLMIAAGALVIAGSYFGMYLERAVDGFFSLSISPLTLIGSYVWLVFALLYRPKVKEKSRINRAET